MNNKIVIPALLLVGILLFDQFVKLYIKTHFMLGEEVNVFGNWFKLHFTENYGMAYGIEFGGKTGKVFLTVFRIIFVMGILWYIQSMAKKGMAMSYVISWTFIAAGALGNIIDSVFYGAYFGYDSWFHGRVVDMLYFPLVQTTIPEWFPFWAGEDFEFFRPVFNIADAAITIGFVLILLTQGHANLEENQTTPEENFDSNKSIAE
jgi:signal peptidase II